MIQKRSAKKKRILNLIRNIYKILSGVRHNKQINKKRSYKNAI